MNKKFLLIISIFLIFSFLFSACSPATPKDANASSESAPTSGVITISGAFALYPLMTRWAEEYAKLYPDIQFDVSAGGAGKGMTDAISGAVDIGMVSREIKPEEEAQGAYWASVTKDAVFPVVNASNPVLSDLLSKGVTQEQLIKIYITAEITTWGQLVGKPEITDEIHVYTRSDAAGAPEMWAKFLGNKLQEDLLGIGVNADPGVLQAVISDPLGIGYNNLGYAYDASTDLPAAGAIVLPIDINANGTADPMELLETKTEAIEAVATNQYPSPPARPLNLVTKGKPTGITQAFILWIIKDGQKYVSEAGYVALTPDILAESLKKIQ
ncbi:MAG: phosphate ABC transporter substrate-binding protein [Chloroflexi bacterium HGW-Chloroflexi-8]|nr:MAG: phosphate ABC transporter substrate-binding protein [Chloroflexi bacterium HGW-Chloroflexi-8]